MCNLRNELAHFHEMLCEELGIRPRNKIRVGGGGIRSECLFLVTFSFTLDVFLHKGKFSLLHRQAYISLIKQWFWICSVD